MLHIRSIVGRDGLGRGDALDDDRRVPRNQVAVAHILCDSQQRIRVSESAHGINHDSTPIATAQAHAAASSLSTFSGLSVADAQVHVDGIDALGLHNERLEVLERDGRAVKRGRRVRVATRELVVYGRHLAVCVCRAQAAHHS